MTPALKETMAQHRVALAALAAALLGAAAFMAVSPGTASAKSPTCYAGNFCLSPSGLDDPGSDALYQFSGSDSNLHNDAFEGAEDIYVSVGDNAGSVFNNAVDDPSGRVDVVVFEAVDYGGAGLCVRQDRLADLDDAPPFGDPPGYSWVNQISSYKFVTPGECSGYPQL